MPRTLARLALTATTAVLLLAVTALPAMAAAGTKPDPDTDPALIGSLDQLVTAAIIGVAFAVLAMALRAPGPGDDGH